MNEMKTFVNTKDVEWFVFKIYFQFVNVLDE